MAAEEVGAGTCAVPDGPAFDDAGLLRNTMENRNLASEVLNLFLVQLPAMIAAAEEAVDESGWALATHTLKGSAALVGALKLSAMAGELEQAEFPGDAAARQQRLRAVRAAAADFRGEARARFPDPA